MWQSPTFVFLALIRRLQYTKGGLSHFFDVREGCECRQNGKVHLYFRILGSKSSPHMRGGSEASSIILFADAGNIRKKFQTFF